MKGTRFKRIIREAAGELHREFKIALTSSPKDKTWVFVVGCYNSGTTLLSELLGHHPDISALPTEGQFLTDQLPQDYRLGLPRMWVNREDLFRLDEDDTGPDPVRLEKEWAMRLDCTKRVLLEKSPPNAARTRWLQANFSNAHFIGITRNPYAVAEGISRKAEPHHLIDGWPIEMSAYQWQRSNEVLFSDAKFLKKFEYITYEDLTENTTETLNKVTNFLHIPDFSNTSLNKNWSIHERNEPLRNMNEENIKNLSNEQIQIISGIASSMMEKLEYKKL